MKQTNAPSVSGLLAGDVRQIRASHSLDSLEAVRPFVPHIIPSGVLPDNGANTAAIKWAIRNDAEDVARVWLRRVSARRGH